jgi:pimeloyl-ACP methyl ester carboxylesterase
MGLNIKPKSVTMDSNAAIEEYYLRGYIAILKNYKLKNATFICHSFSAYLVLLLTLRHPLVVNQHVKQLLLLSPVGLTPKE